MRRVPRALIVTLVLALAYGAGAQTPPATKIFDVKSDELWLNLHHFLYVLGQALGRDRSGLREAVRNAPADEERGLQMLTPAERKTWSEAVSEYAQGLSRRDPVSDEPLARMISALAAAGDAKDLGGVAIDGNVLATLMRVAPLYRKAWWPEQLAGNRAFDATLQRLLAQHGRAILAFVTEKYELAWPASGYAVHLSAYSSWSGAYSTYGNLLVVATNERSGTQGLDGLESVFHEGMHQWDDEIEAQLRRDAERLGRAVPNGLSHALIFYTAGEGVRRVVPERVSQAETVGIWSSRGLGAFRAPLDEIWKPWLDGRGTRDEALAALVARTASATVAPAAGAPPAASGSLARPPSPPAQLFTFETDELWLNLHHFLYVLGRAEARLPDATEPSVVHAPEETQRALGGLTREERDVWAEAVRFYAAGPSRQSSLDDPMPAIARTLADLDDAPSLPEGALEASLRATLERAAPIYRKAWWPAHRAANRAWRSATQALIDRHGAAVVGFVTRAYGLAWAPAGQHVHVSSYANFGGAYSSARTGVLIVSSLSELNAGLRAIECIVHESMHQWDGQMVGALQATGGGPVPRDLTHALIFYTAGEAVHRLDATYVPTAVAYQVWAKRLSGASLPAERLKPALEDVWKPWLDGRGTRDAALAALLERAIAASP